MNKIVIIEDEALSAKRLIRLINDYDDSITILGPFQTTDEVKNFRVSPKTQLQAYSLKHTIS